LRAFAACIAIFNLQRRFAINTNKTQLKLSTLSTHVIASLKFPWFFWQPNVSLVPILRPELVSSPSKFDTLYHSYKSPRNYKLCSLQYYHFILKKNCLVFQGSATKPHIFLPLPHRYFSYIQKLQKKLQKPRKTLKKDHYHPQQSFRNVSMICP